jgi:HEAT repeat protein
VPLFRAGPAAPAPPDCGFTGHLDELLSPDADTRRRAANALGHHEAQEGADQTILAALTRRVRDEPDAGVREAIFTALSNIGGAAAAALVAPLVRLDDAALRNGALEALKRLREDAVAAVDGLLADADADVRLLAVEVMRDWPPAPATARLRAMLSQEAHVNVMGAVLDVAAAAGDAALVPALAAAQARFAGDEFIAFAITLAMNALESRPATPASPAAPASRRDGKPGPKKTPAKKPSKAGP